jgi:FAD/FMN-containing dehydrogenase
MQHPSVQNPTASVDFSQLAAQLPGKVILPGDAQYHAARSTWNRSVDQYPAGIVYTESAQDVAAAVRFARAHGLAVAVQSTGHGPVRAADGAVLINTSRMKDVQIFPQAQTAWMEAGVQWGAVLEQAQLHGLAPLLGSSPNVGVIGYTLGGGLGWLGRKYGMSADSVVRLEVVTPDGVLRTASADENSDLYWALCGGGGGFGVVTGMEIRLYPVSLVYAGNLLYPAHMAREVFQRFRLWVEDAPDELSASIVLMNYPPIPELPPFLSGQSFVIVRGCWCGPLEAGEKLLAYWRDWRAPLVDEFKTIPFSQAASISKDPVNPMPVKGTGGWLRDLSDEAADALIEFTLPQGGPPSLVFSEVRLTGGAIARMDPQVNAFSNRTSPFVWTSVGRAADAAMTERVERQLARMRVGLSACLTGRIYANFADGAEMRQRTQDGFSEQAFLRLQQIKAKYDPENMFSFSYAIPPAKL